MLISQVITSEGPAYPPPPSPATPPHASACSPSTPLDGSSVPLFTRRKTQPIPDPQLVKLLASHTLSSTAPPNFRRSRWGRRQSNGCRSRNGRFINRLAFPPG